MFLLITVHFVPVFAFTEEDDDDSKEHAPGELRIDSKTIHGGRDVEHVHLQPIGYEIAPFLFLEDMRDAKAQLIAQNAEFLIAMRERLFLEEVSNFRFDTSDIVDRLFEDVEAFEHSRRSSAGIQESYFHIPIWIIVIGIVVASGFLLYIAVMFGQKLSNMIHKIKEGEEVSG